MPLHLRRRGAVYHARGTIRVGAVTIEIPSFSTGCRSLGDAQAVAAEREAAERARAIEGEAGRARRLTLADCFLSYLGRPGGVPQYDRDRIADFNERIGDRPVPDARAAWQDWLRTRGASMAPATAARWRAILQAAIGYGCQAAGITAPRLPSVRERMIERAAYLTRTEQDRLLASYSPNAAPVAVLLCFAGLRTQEALRLDWRHVGFTRGVLAIPGGDDTGRRTKSGKGRAVPMHERVRSALDALHLAAGRPDAGPVFLSARGAPYSDTRGQGGNPLAKAHATACRRAGVTGFRVHDWRHHWASWLVMTGCDLQTLMRLGGWSTPRMVQRYASVSVDHMAGAIARLG